MWKRSWAPLKQLPRHVVFDMSECKPENLFSRPCSIFLWSLWLFLLWTDFLTQFSTRWVAVTARTWLNVKNHPPIRDHYPVDQNYQVSNLYSIFVHVFCKPPGSSSLALIWCFFFVTSPSMQHQRAAEWISNQVQMCISDVWTFRARKIDITSGG